MTDSVDSQRRALLQVGLAATAASVSLGVGGMGLRLLDLKTGVWSDYWVNSAFGVLGAAGLTGSFE